ncbi:MAG: helix-turn-helix domain-containing protein [Angelakisella sp.]|nr:helix-turn-helix domain-containing protein [Angelakisella sp.]
MRPYRHIYEEENLSHRARSVYIYLCDRANKEQLCWPAISRIARDLHLSGSTVKRAINDLKQAGYLATQQRWRDNGGRSSLLFELLK